MTDLVQRYARAASLTGPKVAARRPALAVEGYWLTDRAFFFVAEQVEPSTGLLTRVPSTADVTSGAVAEVMPVGTLGALLAAHVGETLDLESLTSAAFDMPDTETLIVSAGEHDYFIDVHKRRVFSHRRSLDVPALYSPDGRLACFVRNHDLWLRERDTGVERPLTTDGALHHSYGRQPEGCLSAVSYRKNLVPMALWSPDSQWLLTHRIDESRVPDLALLQHVPGDGRRPVVHRYKYPMPGDTLPVATYIAIHVPTGRTVGFDDWVAPVPAFSPFASRTVWFGAKNQAWFVRLDRFSREAELITLDLDKGLGRVVLREITTSGYLELRPGVGLMPNVQTLRKSDEVIWYSERDGWGHLYLFDASTGRLKNPITRGQWLVRDLVHVDEDERKIFFLAGGLDSGTDPARRSFCSVQLDGTAFKVLLSHAGDVHVTPTEYDALAQHRAHRPSRARSGVSPDGRFTAVRCTSVVRGDVTQLVALSSAGGPTIGATLPRPDEPTARHFHALAADGETHLHGTMFLPSDFDGHRVYSVIDFIYPGPQAPQQPQAFNSMNSAMAQALSELGFITVMLNTRGTPIGRREFHQAGYPRLLEPQLADHAAVLRQLVERHPFIDGNRIGVIGHSGGGAAVVHALCEYSGLFKVGVAVCGNYALHHYAALWSDKYCGPEAERRGFEDDASAVAHKLSGNLFLISGDMDENVHVSHTLSLTDALIRANRDFDLLIVPNAGHGVLHENAYVQRRIWDYFVSHLLAETPPHFELRFEPREIAAWSRNARQESW